MNNQLKIGKRTDQAKKKRPWLRGVIIAVLLVVVGVGMLIGFFQRNNIKAVYLALTMDSATLTQRQEEQDKRQEELLNQYGLSKPDVSQEQDPADSTQDQQNPEDQSNQDGQQNQDQTQSGGNSSTDSSQEQSAEQAKAEIQGYVNQLYQIEAKYRGRLSGIVASAKQEFYSLPAEERTQKKKLAIVQAKMNTLIAEENSCDAEVEAILAKIQAVLDRQNDKSNLVAEIRAYYQDSKASWKAAQMTELYS